MPAESPNISQRTAADRFTLRPLVVENRKVPLSVRELAPLAKGTRPLVSDPVTPLLTSGR